MNMHFNKALYFLGRGDFEKGEKLIGQALNECTNKLEMIQIKSCYMEVLYEKKNMMKQMHVQNIY